MGCVIISDVGLISAARPAAWFRWSSRGRFSCSSAPACHMVFGFPNFPSDRRFVTDCAFKWF